MCLISLKSYKKQFFKILENLYQSYIYNAIGNFDNLLTFEQCINKIVFGIPTPPKSRMDYLSLIFKERLLPRDSEWQQKKVVELQLFPENSESCVYFQNNNPFDLPSTNFENIWVLI